LNSQCFYRLCFHVFVIWLNKWYYFELSPVILLFVACNVIHINFMTILIFLIFLIAPTKLKKIFVKNLLKKNLNKVCWLWGLLQHYSNKIILINSDAKSIISIDTWMGSWLNTFQQYNINFTKKYLNPWILFEMNNLDNSQQSNQVFINFFVFYIIYKEICYLWFSDQGYILEGKLISLLIRSLFSFFQL
jgi:hypothetical protein